jgi:hypothetical protein
MRRRLVAVLLGVASGGAATVAFQFRKTLGTRREGVDVYFDDGSFVTFGAGSREGARLLPLARQVLVAARRSS